MSAPRRTRRLIAGSLSTLIAATSLGALAISPAEAAAKCLRGVSGDVNGDGYADVAISQKGAVGEERGAVNLFYGSATGLALTASGTALDDRYLDQNSPGISGSNEDWDQFGSATAFGDFNGDGCADLAIALPEEDHVGAVLVLYGSPSGLKTSGSYRLTAKSLGAPKSISTRISHFGRTLTVADLDHDDIDDLAIGAPDAKVGTKEEAGAVFVAYGDKAGLDKGKTDADVVTQATAGVAGSPDGGEQWSSSLVAGDFDGDGRSELAVGAPTVYGGGTAAVQVIKRSGSSYRGSSAQYFRPADIGQGTRNGSSSFGAALAAGDTNGDGADELAIGVPNLGCGEPGDCEDFPGKGAVAVLRGTKSGLTKAGFQLWTQNSLGVDGAEDIENGFGHQLSMGHLDAGSTVDLAIGSPADPSGGSATIGSVTLLLGGAGGLSTDGIGGTAFTEASPGLGANPAEGYAFGGGLAVSRIRGGEQGTLLIGVPGKTVGNHTFAGEVHELAITPAGPATVGSRTLNLETPGVRGASRSFDSSFGRAIS